MKKIVFLDVDDTLIYDTDKINEALIRTLVQKGIKDVYLFTNMSLTDIKSHGMQECPLSRFELIMHLERAGLTVSGVITPADASYSVNGELQPIGTAYTNLYTPLMQRIYKNGALDLQNYSSDNDDIIDYIFNDLEWSVASYISRKKCEVQQGQTECLPLLKVALKTRQEGKCVRFIERDEAKNFFKDEENRQGYMLDFEFDNDIQVTITGEEATDIKGLMMSFALPQIAKEEDVHIYYFDDSKTYLGASQLAIEAFNKAAMNKKANISTCLMPRQYDLSQNNAYLEQYNKCLQSGSYANSLMDILRSPVAVSTLTGVAVIASGYFFSKLGFFASGSQSPQKPAEPQQGMQLK